MTLAAVATLKQHFVDYFPSEAARVLQSLAIEELVEESRGLDQRSFEDVLDLLPPIQATAVFEKSNEETQREFLLHAPPRLLLKVLLPIEAEDRHRLLELLRPSERTAITSLLEFSPNSVATVMESSIGSVQLQMTVKEARHQVRSQATEPDSFVFVTRDDNSLVGRVSMQDLALAQGEQLIAELVEDPDSAVAIHVSDPYDSVAELIEGSEIDALPVVDEHQKLIGVVRHEQLRSVVETSAQTDIQRMVGVSVDERALSRGSLAIRHRFPWLFINLFTAFFAAAIVGMFESLIAQFTALAVLLPVVAGQSGNAGSQAMAVAIRGLALREISFREWFKMFRKELFVGVTNGLLIAMVCAGAVYLWSGQSVGLTIIIALSMVIAMAVAGVAGALVPMLLTRFGQDPATASSIILTTITDAVGFFVFLGIALMLSALI